MTAPTPEPTPAPEPLSAGRIARAALDLIDTEGAERFTLARVAARLGVRAPSLYNHVPSKAVIVEAVRDLVVSEMDYSAFETRPWDVALEAFARSYRSAFVAHPNTITLLFTTPVNAEATFRMYEAVTSALIRAGWPDELAVPIVASVEYLISGSVLDRAARGVMFGHASAMGAPTVARSQQSWPGQAELADRIFDLGLSALLDGLRATFRTLPRQGPEQDETHDHRTIRKHG